MDVCQYIVLHKLIRRAWNLCRAKRGALTCSSQTSSQTLHRSFSLRPDLQFKVLSSLCSSISFCETFRSNSVLNSWLPVRMLCLPPLDRWLCGQHQPCRWSEALRPHPVARNVHCLTLTVLQATAILAAALSKTHRCRQAQKPSERHRTKVWSAADR